MNSDYIFATYLKSENMMEKDLRNALQNKLEEIANLLRNSTDKFDHPGVITGISGLALFMYYYARFAGEGKYAEVGEDALEKAVNMINNGYKYHTFCTGISGLAWTCEHLEKNGFIDHDYFSILSDLDPYLLSCMEKDFGKKNYDFLHGGLGIGYYFLTKRKPNKNNTQTLFQCLKDIAIIDKNDSVKWEATLNDTGRRVYNLSLSHGMSSIVVLLSKFTQIYPQHVEAKDLLMKTVRYILQQKNPKPVVSVFPLYSIESDDDPLISRLGWCYGDLGIASSIHQAGHALGNKTFENEALNILLHNCKRRDLKDNFVLDAGLCHGSAGISHIFHRAYMNTKNDSFKEASLYWIEKTLEMGHYEDGLAGYKTWYGKEKGWSNQYPLLEGIIGIGFSLLSLLNPDLMSWDECMLLS